MAKDAESWYDDHGAEVFEGDSEIPLRKEYEWPAVESLLPALDGKQVLEAGCGSGNFTHQFARRGADVLAIDVSREMIDVARERHGDDVRFRRADLRDPLDFLDDESVDVVVSQLVLDHVENWRPVFEEFYRVLVPGGHVVCSVNHPVFHWEKIRRGGAEEFGLADPTYFDTEQWDADLRGRTGEDRDTVTFYRRSLTSQVNAALDAEFVVDGLREPTPTEGFRREKPEKYEQRLRRPSTFICYRFLKPDRSRSGP